MDVDSFSIPVIEDDDGFYVSKAQMEHFLLRPNSLDELDEYWSSHPDTTGEFSAYVYSCKIYNAIRDICLKDPGACDMVWDEDNSEFIFLYPENGSIHSAIDAIIGAEDE